MPIIYDMHTHTTSSFDGEATLQEQCSRAAELGLRGLAVTDHCDINMQTLEEAKKNFRDGGAELQKMKRKDLPFELFQGIELGEPLEDLSYAEEMLSLLPYDYVIGSIHNIPGEEDFYFINFDEVDYRTMLDPYFDELIRLAEWGKTDSIAHITYPLRYIEGKYHKKVDLSPFQDKIDRLFRTIIEQDLALEINSSGLRQEIHRPLPDEQYILRYYELGGRKIIFGSDAHRWQDLSFGIPECMKLCRKIGLDTAYFYRERIAVPYHF